MQKKVRFFVAPPGSICRLWYRRSCCSLGAFWGISRDHRMCLQGLNPILQGSNSNGSCWKSGISLGVVLQSSKECNVIPYIIQPLCKAFRRLHSLRWNWISSVCGWQLALHLSIQIPWWCQTFVKWLKVNQLKLNPDKREAILVGKVAVLKDNCASYFLMRFRWRLLTQLKHLRLYRI